MELEELVTYLSIKKILLSQSLTNQWSKSKKIVGKYDTIPLLKQTNDGGVCGFNSFMLKFLIPLHNLFNCTMNECTIRNYKE